MNALVVSDLAGRFRDILSGQLGLAFEDSRLELLYELLLRRRTAAATDADAYLDRLERPGAREELCSLARELTVGETYFFRHLQQFDALRAILGTGHADGSGRCPSVLSAGCASGEEAYSLAILLREMLPGRETSVFGLDVNPAVLERARAGRYSAWSLRETSPADEARWFVKNGREFLVDETIRRSVRFATGNLAVDDEVLFRPHSYDIVFCRNVLMYFTPEKFREAILRLTRALVPGGYLFLGSAETLRGVSHDFHLCHTHGAFYYRRKGLEKTSGVPSAHGYAEPRPASESCLPTDLALAPNPTGHWFDDIGRASARIEMLSNEPLRVKLPEIDVASAGQVEAPFRSDLRVPLDLLHREQFAEALDRVRELPGRAAGDPDVLLLEAVLLASGGQLVDAESTCRRLLGLDELNAGAHYVLALCGAGAGRIDAAAYHDRVATYLDPDFAMPRLHLGLLLRRKGESSEAHAELSHARALLQREDAGRLRLFGGGFERAALLALCTAELAATRENS